MFPRSSSQWVGWAERLVQGHISCWRTHTGLLKGSNLQPWPELQTQCILKWESNDRACQQKKKKKSLTLPLIQSSNMFEDDEDDAVVHILTVYFFLERWKISWIMWISCRENLLFFFPHESPSWAARVLKLEDGDSFGQFRQSTRCNWQDVSSWEEFTPHPPPDPPSVSFKTERVNKHPHTHFPKFLAWFGLGQNPKPSQYRGRRSDLHKVIENPSFQDT